MLRHILILTLAIGVVGIFSGCEEKDELIDEAQGFNVEEQAMRKNIFRDGYIPRGLSAYKFAIGSFPSTKQGIQALMERPDGLRDPSAWEGPYLDSEDMMIDPWGNEFKYVFPGATHEGNYDIISFGPDGQEGTDDDYLNWDVR